MITLRISHTVKIFGLLSLLLDIHHVRCNGLHAVREFKTFNAGGELRFAESTFPMLLVQLLEQIELLALRRFRLPASPFQVVDGIPLGPQMRSLKNTRQESRTPISGVTLG